MTRSLRPMSFLLACAIAIAGNASAQAPSSAVPDPLTALQGAWTEKGQENCSKPLFTVSVASDRKAFRVTSVDGRVSNATVLHTEPNRIYLFYQGEKRRTPQGDLLLWWLILDTPESYQMRRIDWPESARTKGTWVKCGSVKP